MIRVGIIGSDSSHGLNFAKLCNLPNQLTGEMNYPGLRITAIYGQDAGQAAQVAAEGGIETVTDSAEELLGRVDAAMVLHRHGGLHKRYAMPFIEAGIPLFVDKPFTADEREAENLIEAALKRNTLITGGSSLKYVPDVQTLAYGVSHDPELHPIVSGYLNFPGYLNSEYAGIFFYGSHAVEMMLTIFGKGALSVTAAVTNGKLLAAVNYGNFNVALNFADSHARYDAIVYGANKALARELDITTSSRRAFDVFYNMLQTKTQPHPIGDLLLPVKILTAIQKSIAFKKEIIIE